MKPPALVSACCEGGNAAAAPAGVLARFLDLLAPVAAESLPLAAATGRILAQPVVADRDSPAADVSAMDGYALRIADVASGGGTLRVTAESRIGSAPPAMTEGAAVRISTGAPTPRGADAVVPREELAESDTSVTLPAGLAIKPGQHIRRAGENIRAGAVVLPAGNPITPAVAAALAAFGVATPRVHRCVRVGLLATGDELLEVEQAPASVLPWQLRDSNSPALRALLGAAAWIELTSVARVRDELAELERALAAQLERCDLVILTGGVSMGDRDYVPAAVERCGAEIIFHRLPIRPGKPLLAARHSRGPAILGLPGNPVSVLTTARRFGVPACRRLAGFADPLPPVPEVRVPDGVGGSPGKPPLKLWWYRPVRLTADGCAALVPTLGSGDIVSSARSDGFIEVPPRGDGPGPWPFYTWSV